MQIKMKRKVTYAVMIGTECAGDFELVGEWEGLAKFKNPETGNTFICETIAGVSIQSVKAIVASPNLCAMNPPAIEPQLPQAKQPLGISVEEHVAREQAVVANLPEELKTPPLYVGAKPTLARVVEDHNGVWPYKDTDVMYLVGYSAGHWKYSSVFDSTRKIACSRLEFETFLKGQQK